MILTYDTETTGMIQDWNAPIDTSKNFPNIVQLGWALHDLQGRLIVKASNIVKPKGWIITKEAEEIHGISQEQAESEGLDIKDVLKPFLMMHKLAILGVAHNVSFDSKVIQSELLREQLKYDFKSKETYCTMHNSTELVGLKRGDRFKWPKLEELHMFLFGERFEGAHDALGDVMATARCFFELMKIGHYKLQLK